LPSAVASSASFGAPVASTIFLASSWTEPACGGSCGFCALASMVGHTLSWGGSAGLLSCDDACAVRRYRPVGPGALHGRVAHLLDGLVGALTCVTPPSRPHAPLVGIGLGLGGNVPFCLARTTCCGLPSVLLWCDQWTIPTCARAPGYMRRTPSCVRDPLPEETEASVGNQT